MNANQFIEFKVMENFLSFQQTRSKNYSVVSADGIATDLNHMELPRQNSCQNTNKLAKLPKERVIAYNNS